MPSGVRQPAKRPDVCAVQSDPGAAFTTLMPVGEYSKDEIRSMAERSAFSGRQAGESGDLFRAGSGLRFLYQGTIQGREIPEGNFVTPDGTDPREHKGIIHYTVGQRKGTWTGARASGFRSEIRPETNEVVIGTYEESSDNGCPCKTDQLYGGGRSAGIEAVFAKIRYNHKGAWCTVGKDG